MNNTRLDPIYTLRICKENPETFFFTYLRNLHHHRFQSGLIGKRREHDPDTDSICPRSSGSQLIHCLRYVTDFYRKNGAKLRNIIIFTIGGTKGIEILENLTREIREFWPEFEGFITVYYEGIFSTYQDKGVSGINLPDVDFYWKDGIIAPEFRRETLSMCSPLFEKCIIYDGGARRYEIHEHVEEVLEFWEGIKERADKIDFKELLDEKIGYRHRSVMRTGSRRTTMRRSVRQTPSGCTVRNRDISRV